MEERKDFSRKGGNSRPQTPEVLENWAKQERERCKGVIWFFCTENMFSFYGFCKSAGF